MELPDFDYADLGKRIVEFAAKNGDIGKPEGVPLTVIVQRMGVVWELAPVRNEVTGSEIE